MKRKIFTFLKWIFGTTILYIAICLLISYCIVDEKISKSCEHVIKVSKYKICIKNLFEYLQSIGLLMTISVFIWKYFNAKEEQEFVNGYIKNSTVSKDKKRLILELYLVNKGKYPVEFEFITKNSSYNNECYTPKNYKGKELVDKLIAEKYSSDEDLFVVVNPNLILSKKDFCKEREGSVFGPNDVCKPIIINKEIYQNFIYMRRIEDDNSIHKDFDQNVIIPPNASIKLHLDISKGFIINENLNVKNVFIYSIKGTIFQIKPKLLERIKNKCKEWMKKQENT